MSDGTDDKGAPLTSPDQIVSAANAGTFDARSAKQLRVERLDTSRFVAESIEIKLLLAAFSKNSTCPVPIV